MQMYRFRYTTQLGKAMADLIKPFGFDKVLQKARQQSGQQGSANMDTRVLRELTFIAEGACNLARDTYKGGNPDAGTSHLDGGYDDHTRNLRGSIGYNIYFQGQKVADGGFDSRGSTEGEAAAKAALASIASQNALWEIVVVAGMHYARYVEAKGYPVLTFVQNYITQECKKLEAKIQNGQL